jgi:hypothetical protein
MAGFLYFVPGVMSLGAEARRGLEFPFSEGLTTVETQRGPSGESGVIGYWQKAPGMKVGTDTIYQPAAQEWVEWRGYWVGMWKDRKPGPGDLAKDTAIGGRGVMTLGDDQEWLIPTLMAPSGEGQVSVLPHSVGLGIDGKVERTPRGEFADLCRRSVRVFEEWLAVASGESVGDVMDEVELVGFILDGLRLNYAVGAAEARLLGLLVDAQLARIAWRMVDLDYSRELLEALEKKKAVSEVAAEALGSLSCGDSSVGGGGC